ncbi:MAG TPA: VanW family protein [Nocardioidaceae bacterium]
MTELESKERSTDRRVVTLLVAGLLVLFGGLYVAGYLFTSDKVPRGTTVSGVEIGGLTPAAARTTLEQELAPRVEEPIVVSADGQRGSIRPAAAGLGVDYAESVEQAGGGRSWSPARMWDYFTGGDDLDAVLDVDESSLEAAVARFAKKVDEKPVEGAVTFTKGTAKAELPETGMELDRDQAADAITEAFLRAGSDPVALEVSEVEPEVSEAKVREAMNDFANPAMSAPVTLRLGEDDVLVRPEAYSRALSMRPEDGELVAEVDKKKLMGAVRPAMRTVALTPVPATVRLVDGQPKVVPGKNGVTFDPDEVVEEFLDAVVERGDNRVLEVETKVDRPDFTTADAKKLGIKEVVSSFTTNFPHAEYRNVNLGRAAEIVNGTVLKPGETFSLNGTVGERTAENGFTEGFIISDGVFKEDFGGGVSQVATTLFNAAFFAGLEDVEHKPHSFYIDRYPIGREATVVWGAVDLKFKNDTPYGILIQSWVNPSTPSSSGAMNVRFWSTKHWDISTDTSGRYNITEEKTRYIQDENCVDNEGYGGFDIDVYRYFRKPGSSEVVRKETFHTTYTPSDTVVCGKPPTSQGGDNT